MRKTGSRVGAGRSGHEAPQSQFRCLPKLPLTCTGKWRGSRTYQEVQSAQCELQTAQYHTQWHKHWQHQHVHEQQVGCL